MAQKARIAIIGTGWWATYSHLPGLQQQPDAEVVALCDRNTVKLEKAANAFGIDHIYEDHKKMIAAEDLDGVIIVTPHATHYQIARDCLQANLHLLLEKPMTLHAWEARQLVEEANYRNREILIGYVYPYFSPVLRAREVIQSGELGNIQFINSCFCTDVFGFLNGGVSADHSPIGNFTINSPGDDYNNPELLGGGEGHLQLTHSVSAMLHITGDRAHKVHAMMKPFGLKVDLVDVMMVEFESGAIGTVGGSGNAGKSYDFNLSIFCEYGHILVNTPAHRGYIRYKDGSEEDLMKLLEEKPSVRYPVDQNFVDVILKRATNGSSGELGLRTVEILDAAYQSANLNGEGILISNLYESIKQGA